MKIVSINPLHLFLEHLDKLKTLGEVIVYQTSPQHIAEAVERIKDADVVINFSYLMSKDIIAKAEKLKLICIPAVGYENIDIAAAKERSIVVCNCPTHNREAVAEFTIGLLIAASRLLHKAETDIRNGIWIPEGYKGKQLANKTLGIIGYGHIGRRIGEIAQNAFGMQLVTITSKSSRDDFEKLLKTSDFISINAPKNKTTEGLVGEKEFALMKPGVVIVNTGRGAILDEASLIKYMQSGKVFAAGIDVLSKEPMNSTAQIFSLSQAVITPHTAWTTDESEYNLSEEIVKNIEAFVNGNPINIINN